MKLRRVLPALIGVVVLVFSCVVYAKEAGRIARIGFISSTNPVGTPHYAAFLDGLREQGYVEGKNILIEHRWTDRKLEQLPAFAEELVNLKVDLIVAWSSHSVAAAKQATKTIPIVMVAVGDPVGSGFVSSLARPEGNITGMSNMLRATVAKSVEMLKTLVPEIKRIAVLRVPANPGHILVLKEVEDAARNLGLRLQVLDVDAPADIDKAFSAIVKERADGLLILGDQIFVGQRRHIADLALQARLPSITIFNQYPEAGGLMSYGFNTLNQFRRTANFVVRILQGTKPADLPVEQPSTFELVINLKTARALGLQIPESLLLRADKIIE